VIDILSDDPNTAAEILDARPRRFHDPNVDADVVDGLVPENWAANVINNGPMEIVPVNMKATFEWPHLEFFRCRSAMPADRLETIVAPSIMQGALKTLDVASGDARPHGGDFALSPPQLSFSSMSLETLGMSSFLFDDTDSYSALFTAKPFLDWLSKFPNVHTVAAYPSTYARCADVIKALLSHKGIKRIYQDCLTGVVLDEVRAEANKRGIEIIHQRRHMAPIFPRSFVNDLSD
jgi:hypothetical protein